MHQITYFLENLPEAAERVKALVGENRMKMPIIAQWEDIPDDSTIHDAVMEAGYGTDYGHGRLIAMDGKGRQIKSISLPPIQINNGSSIEHRLVDAVLASNDCLRRFVGTLSSTLEKREDTLEAIMDRLIASREETLAAESTSLALDLALQTAEEDSQTDIKERALQSLETLAELAMKKIDKRKTPSAENLLEIVKDDPALIDEIAKNEELVAMIATRIFPDSDSDD
jgi:hypothetical protein